MESQLKTWKLARDNYHALSDILVRTVHFDNYKIRLQFNPKRIISSSAKIDPQSLSERPCFLCTHNRPAEQVGITYLNRFLILLNPYPVFSPHFTVSSVMHTPQRIRENFGSMLSLARDMQGYVIIYNGPNCGASAPDHFHFQAVSRLNMPAEHEYHEFIKNKLQISSATELGAVAGYNRSMLAVISRNEEEARLLFGKIYGILEHSLPSAVEPMMNILTWYDNGKWIILIFPRKSHRPWQYFETGERQILLSPASIDMGGVLIIPRKEDYEKMTRNDIEDMLNQVCVDDDFIYQMLDRIKKDL